MMKNRIIITLLIIVTLLFSLSIVANPGSGMGTILGILHCGGSCHGDPSLSVESDGIDFR